METTMQYQELKVLVFVVNDTRFGIDMEQVAALRQFNTELDLVPFHELLGIQPVSYHAPQLLVVKVSHAPAAVLINQPEDMVDIALQDIRPLPGLIANLTNPYGVWGIVPQRLGMLVLVDFYKNMRFMQPARS